MASLEQRVLTRSDPRSLSRTPGCSRRGRACSAATPRTRRSPIRSPHSAGEAGVGRRFSRAIPPPPRAHTQPPLALSPRSRLDLQQGEQPSVPSGWGWQQQGAPAPPLGAAPPSPTPSSPRPPRFAWEQQAQAAQALTPSAPSPSAPSAPSDDGGAAGVRCCGCVVCYFEPPRPSAFTGLPLHPAAGASSGPEPEPSESSGELYVVMISLHGLVRGENMELGRDADTGGQVRQAAAVTACMPRPSPQLLNEAIDCGDEGLGDEWAGRRRRIAAI